MAETFLLEIATPERLFVREQVTDTDIPAKKGYVEILPGHAAMLSELGEGELHYTHDGQRHTLYVEGGWLEVSNAAVRVLATRAR